MQNGRALYQKHGTISMAEMFCAVSGLGPLGQKKLCHVPGEQRPRGLNAASTPREDVEREVRTILERHRDTLPKTDEALIAALFENWRAVACPALVLGKGNKQRVVPIGRTALALLQSYLRAVRPHLLQAGAETALFLDARGHRLPYHTLLRVVHQHTADLELPVPVAPHTFRRSCATEMIRAGANLYHVKDLLGHESLETLHHYTLLTIEDLKRTHARCHPRDRSEDP